ncbi:MAG: hypothetical protein R3C05_19555 [Pirellulaceae bacterium]
MLVAWAAHSDGYLGVSYVVDGIANMKFRPQETEFIVYGSDARPVEGASITVFEGGVDDITHPVPPRIQELIAKQSSRAGKVVYPGIASLDGLGDQTILVRYGSKSYIRDGFQGPGKRIFVLSNDPRILQQCGIKTHGKNTVFYPSMRVRSDEVQ